VTVPATCGKTCAPCEVLDSKRCECAPKAGPELAACFEKHCSADDPRHCEGVADLADAEASELRRIRLYQQACSGRVGRACYRLGEASTERAGKIAYYESACDGGYAAGCTKAAELVGGAGATELYGRACNQTNPGAGDVLACRRYAEGIRATNPARARTLLDAACIAGDTVACARYGELAEHGEGGPRDGLRARAAYRQACFASRGDPSGTFLACHRLALLLRSDGDEDGSRRALERACDAGGVLPSCEDLGDAHARRKETNEAQRRYERACSDGRTTGVPSACFKLGELFDVRGPGNTAGIARARVRYDQACARGVAKACAKSKEITALLGDLDGDGVLDLDDRCPSSKEDKDGFADDDGCVDLDDDGDAIPDAVDRCRTVPETRNGVEDTDGCPEGSLTVDVTCNDEKLAPSEANLTLDGNAFVPTGDRYVLPIGDHELGASSTWCLPAKQRIRFQVGQGEQRARLDLARGSLATVFAGVAPSNRVANPGWSLRAGYARGILAKSTRFSNEPVDGPAVSFSLPEARNLDGIAVSAGAVDTYVVFELEAGYSRSVDVAVTTFPGVKLGARLPFGVFALTAGGSMALERWSFEHGAFAALPNAHQLAFAPWAEFQAKVTHDIGITASGGYRFGVALEDNAGVDYGFVHVGAVVQPSPEGLLAATGKDAEAAWAYGSLRASYQALLLPRPASLTRDQGASGFHLAGAQALHGATLELAPEFSPWLVATIGVGYARGVNLRVDEGIPGEDEVASGAGTTRRNFVMDVNAWTVPSATLGARLPLGKLALEAALSYDNMVWTAPFIDGSDTSDFKLNQFGMLLGVHLRPTCAVGFHATGGYKWGVGIDSSDGLDLGYVSGGIEVQSCP